MSDPLDMLAPSVPNVGGVGPTAGPAGTSPRVDPFPYGSPQQANYDPYSHAPSMQMPDARDYGGYAPYGGHEGGYGVAAGLGGAAAGAGAYGATSGYGDSEGYAPSSSHGDPSQGYYGGDSPGVNAAGVGAGAAAGAAAGGASAGAIAKQRESAMERQRQRQSAGFDQAGYGMTPAQGSSGQANRQSVEGPGSDGEGRRTSAAASVYQHTDYGSMPDEEDDGPGEIPPK